MFVHQELQIVVHLFDDQNIPIYEHFLVVIQQDNQLAYTFVQTLLKVLNIFGHILVPTIKHQLFDVHDIGDIDL